MSDDRDDRTSAGEGGFRVTDRRRFSDSGDPRPDQAGAGEAGDDRASDWQSQSEPVPVTFSSFVLGLSTQALMHLGEVPDPTTGTVAQDLGAAKHVIDILGLLQHKTQGNLDEAEAGLVQGILYDLRMRYVDLVRHDEAQSRKETS